MADEDRRRSPYRAQRHLDDGGVAAGLQRAARALTGDAVIRVLRGEQPAGLAAMAKNVATDMSSFACDQAVQLHGGAGYMRDTLVARLYRDARLHPIGGRDPRDHERGDR